MAVQAENGVPAVIEDSDGYTNIRAAESKDSRVVGRVLEGERFAIYPTERPWWRMRTTNNVTGFIHRSRVRLLNESTNAAKPSSVSIKRDEATLTAWKFYVDMQEKGRKHSRAGGEDYTSEWIIEQLKPMTLTGVDSTVVAFLQDVINQNKYEGAMHKRVMGSLRAVAPAIKMRDTLRPLAGVLGARLMPEAPELGSVLGEILVYYVFYDSTIPNDLPDDGTMFRMLRMHDRMLLNEALINTALDLEQPEGIKILLGRVRNRAFSAKFQTGHWIFDDVDGGRGDLEFKQDPKSAYYAGGWVTMKWRNRRIDDKYFLYELLDDGTFLLKDTSLFGALAGRFAFQKSFRVKFSSAPVLELTEMNGEPRGTWKQVSTR